MTGQSTHGVRGFPNRDRATYYGPEFEQAAVLRAGYDKAALLTLALNAVQLVAADAAEASTTSSVIVATAHAAIQGDVILWTSGALNKQLFTVHTTAANSITLAQASSVAASAGDTFDILRLSVQRVDSSGLPAGAATLAEQQTQTTSLQLIDDAVYTDGTGAPSKAIGVCGTDGTNPQILKTDASGELQTDVLTIPNVTLASQANPFTSTIDIEGQGAHDSEVSGNPVNIGATARSTYQTAVTTNDAVRLMADLVGRLIISPYAHAQALVDGESGLQSDTNSHDVIAAQGGGVRTYITEVTFTNRHASTSVTLSFRDGTTVKKRVEVAGLTSVPISFPAPLRGSDNTAWTVVANASVSDWAVSASGFVATI